MEHGRVRKKILSFLTEFGTEHGFQRYKPTALFKQVDNVVSMIVFDMAPGSRFYCNVLVQPLYIPRQTTNMDIGARLEYFSVTPVVFGNGGDVESDLRVVNHLMVSSVLPWLSRVGTPRGIVVCLTEPPWARLRPVSSNRDEYLGFSYAYLGMLEDGLLHITREIDNYKSDNRAWAVKRRQILSEFASVIVSNPDLVPQKLIQYAEFTRTAIGLPHLV